MKKNKVLFWAACLFSVLSFTSCLSDEENDVRNKQMTPAERVTAYNTVRGSLCWSHLFVPYIILFIAQTRGERQYRK